MLSLFLKLLSVESDAFTILKLFKFPVILKALISGEKSPFPELYGITIQSHRLLVIWMFSRKLETLFALKKERKVTHSILSSMAIFFSKLLAARTAAASPSEKVLLNDIAKNIDEKVPIRSKNLDDNITTFTKEEFYALRNRILIN